MAIVMTWCHLHGQQPASHDATPNLITMDFRKKKYIYIYLQSFTADSLRFNDYKGGKEENRMNSIGGD